MSVNNFGSVDVVIPVHGKSQTLKKTLSVITRTLSDESGYRFRFLIVLDGPDEQCRRHVLDLQDTRVVLIELATNHGKGFALREACSDLKGQLTIFMDADLDIDPAAALWGIKVYEKQEDASLACVYGSKFHRESEVIYPLSRRFFSAIFRKFVKLLLRIDVEDTQTGLKVFDSARLRDVISDCRERRFLFDVELLTLLGWRGGTFSPMPVRVDFVYDSTIKIRDVLVMAFDLVRLAVRMRLRHQSVIEVAVE